MALQGFLGGKNVFSLATGFGRSFVGHCGVLWLAMRRRQTSSVVLCTYGKPHAVATSLNWQYRNLFCVMECEKVGPTTFNFLRAFPFNMLYVGSFLNGYMIHDKKRWVLKNPV